MDLSGVSSSAAEIAAAAQTSSKSPDTLICSPAKEHVSLNFRVRKQTFTFGLERISR